MCGIGGIINQQQQKVSAEQLQQLAHAVRHRGPDGEGFFVHEQVGFAHRRLAVIGPGAAGGQPMHYAGLTITYNGEIYNYIELRETLRSKGFSFSTTTDTEVLLAAYKHWGAACVHHFNGMWAFALYDAAAQTVFFSRDRFGEKPFYYTIYNGQFIFCSEIKGLLAVTSPAKANMNTVLQYLVSDEDGNINDTFFDGIHKLPAGHNGLYHIASGKFAITRYYDLPGQFNKPATEADAVAHFREIFERSVKLRLRSDVKAGTCLSGGLDSSYVAATAARLYRKAGAEKFTAVTAGTGDAATDETAFARRVVDVCGLRPETIVPAPHDFSNALPAVMHLQEEPFASPSVLMQYFVMQQASRAGITVLLDGQGADELLFGYAPALVYLHQSLPLPGRLSNIATALKHYDMRLADYLRLTIYLKKTSLRKKRLMQRWSGLRTPYKNQLQHILESGGLRADNKGSLAAYRASELSQHSLPALLRYEDKNAMHFGVETRLPFLDPHLVELVMGFPAHLLLQNGWSKYILRKAMEPVLPPDIVWRRKKVGFAASTAFSTAAFETVVAQSSLLQELFQNKPIKGATANWKIVSLALWAQSKQI